MSKLSTESRSCGAEHPRRRYARLIVPTAIASLTLALSSPTFAFTYTVRSGDTLFKLSQRYGVSLADIQAANSNWSGYIEVGQQIVIPDRPGVSQPGAGNGSWNSSQRYTVQPGDTLYLIARRYGVSLDELQRLNGWNDQIYPGQVILLPASSGNGSGGGSWSGSGSGWRYTVQSGDTLYLVAQRYGVTVAQLRQANGIWSDTLYPGQVLVIPNNSGTGTTPGGSNGTPVPSDPQSPPKLQLSWDDQMLLARLVRAEAEGEPLEGQVAVAATVLNRLNDPRFPHSVPGIIYQVVDGYYQYSPVQNGRINLPPTPAAQQAVSLALQGWDPSRGANGFYRPDGVSANNWVRQQPVTAVIGNHIFFRS